MSDDLSQPLIRPDDVTPARGESVAGKIADLIRVLIVGGTLRTGDPLPGDRVLAGQIRRSREVVNNAYQQLADQGYLILRERHRPLVRKPPPARVLNTDRYRRELDRARAGDLNADLTSFCVDYGITYNEWRVAASYEEMPATELHALLLSVPPGTPVLRRHLVELVRDVPVQIRRSVMPLRLVRGTDVADPAKQPWPGGTIWELFSLGYAVTQVDERVTRRLATTAEAKDLLLTDSVKVLEDVRRFIVAGRNGGRPIEASELILPEFGNSLEFTTRL